MNENIKEIKSKSEQLICNLVHSIITKYLKETVITFKYGKDYSIMFGNLNDEIQNILGAKLERIIDWNNDDTRVVFTVNNEGLLKELQSPHIELWIPNNGEKVFDFDYQTKFQVFVKINHSLEEKLIELDKRLVLVGLKGF
jgi:hypothetical protein